MLKFENQWISMDLSGFQWISMDLDGSQWISVDLNGSQWISMYLSGSQRISVDLNGSQWFSVLATEIQIISIDQEFAISTLQSFQLSTFHPAGIALPGCGMSFDGQSRHRFRFTGGILLISYAPFRPLSTELSSATFTTLSLPIASLLMYS